MLAYVLQVKVEMELEIQQCEKTKAVREEQLERLTQICQEQAVSTSTTESETALQDCMTREVYRPSYRVHN